MTYRPLVLAAALGFLAVGCTEQANDATRAEEAVAERQTSGFLASQPPPVFNWSQLRQNLIEIATAQANTTATTSFFFNVGVADPVGSCPSIGFPIPSTAQLTNPAKIEGNRDGGYVAVAQIESNGIYTGDSSGTYVICIDPDGRPYADYWEGYVRTVTGPAEWDAEAKSVVLVGAPTGGFTGGQG